jgi:hypothetical protein
MDEVCIFKGFGGKRGQRIKFLAVLGAGISGISFLYVFNPASSNFYIPCPFHKLTGLHCPGCGSLRAIHHLLHGHVVTALRLNALMVLLLPFLGYNFVTYMMGNIRGRPLPPLVVPAIAIWVFLGVVLLFWGIRNISTYPFSLLTLPG